MAASSTASPPHGPAPDADKATLHRAIGASAIGTAVADPGQYQALLRAAVPVAREFMEQGAKLYREV